MEVAPRTGGMIRGSISVLLASGGYPWTVIGVDDRAVYLASLGRAGIDRDMKPFARFLDERVESALELVSVNS